MKGWSKLGGGGGGGGCKAQLVSDSSVLVLILDSIKVATEISTLK